MHVPVRRTHEDLETVAAEFEELVFDNKIAETAHTELAGYDLPPRLTLQNARPGQANAQGSRDCGS